MTYARIGNSTCSNELGIRPMQERAYEKRGEQYLLIKEPPQWNLCDAPGADEPRVAQSKVAAARHFLESEDRVLVCTHATFRFAVDELGAGAFDGRLIAVDEFHHVSADPDNRLGAHLGRFIERGKAHIVAMTGSYFRGDAVPVLPTESETKSDTFAGVLTGRYGLVDDVKSFAAGSLLYEHRTVTTPTGSSSLSKIEFGDVAFGVRHAVLKEALSQPGVIISGQGVVPTNGNNGYGVGGGMALVKSIDPVALFASGTYLYTFSSDPNFAGEIQADDTIIATAGYSLTLNDTLAIGTSVSGHSMSAQSSSLSRTIIRHAATQGLLRHRLGFGILGVVGFAKRNADLTFIRIGDSRLNVRQVRVGVIVLGLANRWHQQ